MLNFALQQAPFRFGLAEGVDPHQVPFGTLVTAENVCWDRSGRLQKRLGVTPLSTNITGGGAISSASRLIVRGNELAMTDGTNLYSYIGVSWTNRGRLPEVGLQWYTSFDTASGFASFDSAYLAGNSIVEVWVVGDPAANYPNKNGTLYYHTRDITTGNVITGATQIDTAVVYGIRIVTNGSTWALVYATTGGNLKCFTGGTIYTLQTDVSTTIVDGIDACVIGANFVVVYPTASGNIRILRYTFAGPPVVQANQQISTETVNSIAVAGAAGEHVYIAWTNGSAVRGSVADPSTMVPIAAFNIDSSSFAETLSIARETSTTALLIYSESATTGRCKSVGFSSAGAVTAGQFCNYLRPMSRPFLLNGRFYCVMNNEFWALAMTISTIVTSDTFLVDVTRIGATNDSFRLVGKIDALTGGTFPFGFVTSANIISATQASVSVCYQSQLSAQRGGMVLGIRYVTATIGASVPKDMWRNISIGQESYISAGVLTSFDGLECLGYGYPYGPYIDVADTSPSNTGGSMAAGRYVYNVTAERRSNVGVLHRSPVGISYAVTLAGTGTAKVTVAIVPSSLGHSMVNPGHFPIYRTTVNGSILQRIAMEPAFMMIPDKGFTGAAPVTINDISADSSINNYTDLTLNNRPALYTEGGELEDTQLPSCLTLTMFQNRIWLVGGDGYTLYFSKDITDNPGTAPGFHPSMSLTFADNITAICAMDDKLIVFGNDGFWYIVGEGPAVTGAGATYDVGAVQSDVGCINPRSVVPYQGGIIFQSIRGLHLLTRQLEVKWLGRPVKDQLASYPNITSGVLVAGNNEIRWSANNNAGTAGIVLVYNYIEDQWSTNKYTIGGVYGPPIADACIYNERYYFVTTGGVVAHDEPSFYLDSGSVWVPITLETAWVSASGPLAYQSIRTFALEGVSMSDHDLTVSVGFNNATSYAQTKTFVAGTTGVTSVGPLESCELSIGTLRKCQSIRFKIQDATPTGFSAGTGQGPTIDMMGIEVGMKKGFMPKASTQVG